MWQDLALSILQLGFVPALWDVLKDSSQKVPRKMSVKTAALLWAMGIVMATVGWWWSALSTAAVAASWTYIAWRRAP